MDKVRVGLIGAGEMANSVHYPSLAESDDAEMVALSELVDEKRASTAKRFGIPRQYADYRRMFDEERIDAVYILMPPHHLYDVVMDALERGLHVFIEKPPAVTTFQTESMARLARENGCIGMVGFNRRYIPMLNYAKEKVLARAGRVTQAVATFFKQASAVYYRGAVDVIGCDAIHAVDALRWMAGGEATAVASVIGQYDDVVPNSWNAVVSFDNGATGVLMTNWNTGGRSHRFEMHGPGISAVLDPNDKGFLLMNGASECLDAKEVAQSGDWHKYYGFYAETRHFIESVRSGVEPSSSFADAVGTMKLVDSIREKAISEGLK